MYSYRGKVRTTSGCGYNLQPAEQTLDEDHKTIFLCGIDDSMFSIRLQYAQAADTCCVRYVCLPHSRVYVRCAVFAAVR